jgi:Rha family phage regulatory protein
MSKVLVFKKEDKIVTDSLTVANEFGKRHADVLRKIDALREDLPNDFHERNFERSETVEQNAIGGEVRQVRYDMTRDGWIYLVMSFTGKKAAAVKLVFISEFNRMEAELVGRGIQKAPLKVEQILEMALAEIKRLTSENEVLQADLNYTHLMAVDHATAAGLTAKDILQTCPKITQAADMYRQGQKNKDAYNPAAWVTIYLRQVKGINPAVKQQERYKKYGRFLYNRLEIENVEAHLD